VGFGEKLCGAIARGTMTGVVASTETQKGDAGDGVRASAIVPACLLGLLLAGCVTALPGEDLADAARVRVTTDRELARDCAFLGMASDTSETALQRKAAWLGGDVAVVTLASQEARADTSWYKSVTSTAEVFRCEAVR
jgi:hypothetical protein